MIILPPPRARVWLARLIDKYSLVLKEKNFYPTFLSKHTPRLFWDQDEMKISEKLWALYQQIEELCKNRTNDPTPETFSDDCVSFYRDLMLLIQKNSQDNIKQKGLDKLATWIMAITRSKGVLNIRQGYKLSSLAMSWIPLTAAVRSLLIPEHKDNSTPYKLYKSHVLALKLADNAYWASNCYEGWLRLIDDIDVSAQKHALGLNDYIDVSAQKPAFGKWIPSNLRLCLLYSEYIHQKSYKFVVPHRDLLVSRSFLPSLVPADTAIEEVRMKFYGRRASERGDSQNLPSHFEASLKIILDTPSLLELEDTRNFLHSALEKSKDAPEMLLHFSWLYDQGVDVVKDPIKSQQFRLKAANAYFFGKDSRQDYKKAAFLYQELADKNQAEAMNNLGWMLEKGLGVDPDPERAFTLYQRSANQGYLFGLFNMAQCYREGTGVEQNHGLATSIFQDAYIDHPEALAKWKKARGTE